MAAGVVKAAEDALALAEALDAAGDVEQALCGYEIRRIGIGRRIIERARHLGAYLQAERRTLQERDFAARHRTVEAVMAETAVVDFLYTSGSQSSAVGDRVIRSDDEPPSPDR